MTNEEAIKYLQQLYPQGGHCWLDEQRLEAISMAIESLSHSVTKKSDQVERIRAEIEKRYRENKADGYSDVCEELWDILSFIDSMQDKEKYYRSDDTPDTAGYDLTEDVQEMVENEGGVFVSANDNDDEEETVPSDSVAGNVTPTDEPDTYEPFNLINKQEQ